MTLSRHIVLTDRFSITVSDKCSHLKESSFVRILAVLLYTYTLLFLQRIQEDVQIYYIYYIYAYLSQIDTHAGGICFPEPH